MKRERTEIILGSDKEGNKTEGWKGRVETRENKGGLREGGERRDGNGGGEKRYCAWLRA